MLLFYIAMCKTYRNLNQYVQFVSNLIELYWIHIRLLSRCCHLPSSLYLSGSLTPSEIFWSHAKFLHLSRKAIKRKRYIWIASDSIHQYPIFIIFLKIYEIGPSNPKHKTFWMTLESLASQIPLLAWMCCAPRNCSFKTGKSTSWWIPFTLKII